MAFAISDLHASIRSSPFVPLSVEYVYYHACLLKMPFDPHSGVTLHQILHAVEKEGQPEETQWPYLIQLPTDLNKYKPPKISGSVYRRLGKAVGGPVVDKISEELKTERLCMLVFRSSLALVLAKPGIPVIASPNDQPLRPHAVLAVAIGENASERFVKVRNSWGEGWADCGYAWLSEQYIQSTFIDLVRME